MFVCCLLIEFEFVDGMFVCVLMVCIVDVYVYYVVWCFGYLYEVVICIWFDWLCSEVWCRMLWC